MKLDRPSGYGPVSATGLRSAGAKSVSPASEARPARDETSVRESDAAAIAKLGAPVDQSRIDELRSAIAEGRYLVDPGKLAQKMIALDIFGDA